MEWPWQYSFPPFFTIQPNKDTREKQLDAWKELVLSYCKHEKIEILDIHEAPKLPLFNNADIQRSLKQKSIVTVLEYLNESGNLEWLDKEKSRCLVFWRSPNEWAKLIYDWVNATGSQNSVFTLYEMNEGDTGKDTEFHGIGNELLLRALQKLESDGKAQLMKTEPDVTTYDGVKFL
eukprot:m.19692 g.19692  ORF g.19692 m.19692 type:complete len:177 (-) comp6650_c0_seq1:4038-4568(-)